MREEHASFKGVLYGLIVLFSTVSWYTTGVGLSAFKVPLPVAFIMSLGVQIALAIMALRVLPGSGPWRQWPFFVITYALVAAFSIVFSVSFYFGLFSAEDYGESLFESDYYRVLEDAKGLTGAYARLTDGVSSLSNFSDEMAKQEDTGGGGTCWQNRGSGKGAFFYKRQFQRELFREWSREFNGTRGALDKIVSRLEDVFDDRSTPVVKRLGKLRALCHDLKADYAARVDSGYREELQNYIDYEFRGYPDNLRFQRFDGGRDACKDQATAEKMRTVLAVDMPEAGECEISKFNPADRMAVVTEISMALRDVIFAVKQKKREEGEDPGVFSEQYIPAFVVGLAVDTMILIIGILIQMQTRKIRWRSGDLNLLAPVFQRMFPLVHRYPEFLSLENVSGNRPTTVGYASDLLSHIVRKISFEIDGEHYIFFPLEHEGDLQVRTKKAARSMDLVDEVMGVLDEHRFIGQPWESETVEFEGYNLDNYKKQFSLTDRDLGLGGKFRVFHIQPRFFEQLSAFAGQTCTFAEHPQGRRMYQHFGIPNHVFDRLAAMLMSGSIEERALHVLERLRKSGKDWRLTLYTTNQVDRELLRWLRDDDHGFNKLVTEKEKKGWWGVRKFLPIHEFVFDEAAYDRIASLAPTAT